MSDLSLDELKQLIDGLVIPTDEDPLTGFQNGWNSALMEVRDSIRGLSRSKII